MRKVIVEEWMTLDGVVQAPGAPDEDRTGGFEHGGRHMRYFDDLSQQRVVEGLAEAGGFLLGRRTDFFVHRASLDESVRATEGERVDFEWREGGMGPEAINVAASPRAGKTASVGPCISR